MRKILTIFFVLSLFILNLVFLGYASSEVSKETRKNANEEEQKLSTQSKKYKWEISTSIYLDVHREWSDRYPYSDTTTALSIPLRVGFYFTKNLEIEPEMIFLFLGYDSSSSESLFLAFINVALNFSTDSQVRPFILGGVGMSNLSTKGILIIPEAPFPDFKELAWNAGAGLKWFIAKKVALRLDYRFIYYSRQIDERDIYDYDSHHKVFMGISLFFK